LLTDDEGTARRDAKVKTVAEELHDIAAQLFEDCQLEIAAGEVPPERALAMGMAIGAVFRARAEHLEQRAKYLKERAGPS